MLESSFRIKTERLILRLYNMGDCENIYNIMKDEDMFTYTPDKPWESIDSSREFIELALWLYSLDHHQQFRYFFAVIEKRSGNYIGYCGVGGIEYNRSENEVFYGIGKDYCGKGYATEAAKALIIYAFEDLGLDRLIGAVHPENKASIRVLEKTGLKRIGVIEGLQDEHSFFNGEYLFELTSKDYTGS